MPARASSKPGAPPRLSGRDYAIMRKVAAEAVEGFKEQIPPMVESTVANMLERIGIDVSTAGARSSLRTRFVSLSQADDNRKLMMNRALGTAVGAIVMACLGGLVAGTVLWLNGIHLVSSNATAFPFVH